MKKYVLVISFLISVVFNLFLRKAPLNIALTTIIFQIAASLVLGYVVSMFQAKYKSNDWKRWWSLFYLFMVVITVVAYYLRLLPS